MSWSLLVQNVDGAQVDGIWGPKPTEEELYYCIGGMWSDEQEKEIIDSLLTNGYYSVQDSACTTYELNN